MNKRGFTLIELLVVIAIIGILSSVVLASLNSARAKGADASIKSSLANMRAQAELYYDGTGANKYGAGVSTANDGVCASSDGILNMLNSVKNMVTTATDVKCYASSTAWAVSAPLKTTGTWCVDSTGKSGTSTATGITAAVCN